MIPTSWFLFVSLLIHVSKGDGGDDKGYENLFTTSNVNVARTCTKTSALKDYGIQGSFFISSVAQFELHQQKFTAALDGFGKYHKFKLSENEVCYTSRMIESNFYLQSLAKGEIAASLLFNETIPARNTTRFMENILGSNDNLYVNILKIGSDFRSNTDAQFMLSFDPKDLSVKGKVHWMDGLDVGKIFLGTAHPLLDLNTKCYFSFDNQVNVLGTRAENILMKICPNAPNRRVEVNRYQCPYLPYIHSFGLTKHYAIVPHQLFTLDFQVLEKGGSLSEAFTDVKPDNNLMEIYLIPKDGSNTMKFQVPPFYYVHFLNSFETKDAIVFDTTSYEANPLAGGLSIEQSKDPTQRNQYDPANSGMIKRYTLYISGANVGKLQIETKSKQNASTDFATYNYQYTTESYCIYYAVEWWHDDEVMGSMAIVKHNMCTGDVQYWYKASHFPSEPTFIPRRHSATEDDGVLVFTVLDGERNGGFFVIVDATTMQSIDEVQLPTGITFTAHGQFFSDE